MDRKRCPRCGTEMRADSLGGLCPACLLTEAATATKSGIGTVCSSCRSDLLDGARFCAQCGAAVEEPGGAEGDPIRVALEAKLRGQYRIVRMLGRGGMGAVYLARDLTLEREVAIKVVNGTASSAEMYDRFRREAKTAAKLSHPNIVPLHAFGEVEGMPYFVMGYVRGESLASKLRREGRLAEDEVRKIVGGIADALDHAHRQGVIHRDVKPDNVLLDDESGRAMLTDFGVAKAHGGGETLTQLGSVVGTPQFMSPEQAAGRADVDGRTDIYSLGVMAYAMLAGRLPFEGKSAADFLTKHLTQDVPALRSVAVNVSDPTAQAVEKCLAKDPAARWPDARSLKVALGAGDDSALPDDLQAVDGHGMLGLAVTGLLLLFIAALRAPRFALLLNAGVVVLIYVAALIRLRLNGIAVRDAQRAIWTEPSWWIFWYPRSLRRGGNVWDRLPASVRAMRWWNTSMLVLFMLLFVGEFPNVFRSPRSFAIKIGAIAVMMVIGLVLRINVSLDLRRRGLNRADVHRVSSSIPVSRASFWARPHVASLLLPAAEADAGRRASPHEYLQSILRQSGELSGPLRALGAQAGVAARQLIESIEQADQEIAALMRNVEPGEEERLAEKIRALSPSTDATPLRSLLEKQLELVRGIAARIEETQERRNRRIELLKTLALHISALRARLTEPPSEIRSLTDTVRALCDTIANHVTAPLEHSR